MKKRLNKRVIISLLLLFSLVMMPISALVAHIMHGTTISHKYLHAHVLFGVLFIVSAVFHVVYNWRTLKFYLFGKKDKNKQ